MSGDDVQRVLGDREGLPATLQFDAISFDGRGSAEDRLFISNIRIAKN